VQRLQETRDLCGNAENTRVVHQESESSKCHSIELASSLLHGVTPILQEMMVEIDSDWTSLGARSAERGCKR
jgi:hypothetical protein